MSKSAKNLGLTDKVKTSCLTTSCAHLQVQFHGNNDCKYCCIKRADKQSQLRYVDGGFSCATVFLITLKQ